MVYTSISGVQVPDATDGFNPPAQFKTWVDKASEYDYYIPVADLNARNALTAPELREGLLVAVKADNTLYYYTGSGWALVWEDVSSKVNISTFGTGWTPSGGANTPRIARRGDICYIFGSVVHGSGASLNNLLTIPSQFLPVTSGVRYVGTAISGNGGTGVLRIDSGILQFAFNTLAPGVGNVVALSGYWLMD